MSKWPIKMFWHLPLEKLDTFLSKLYVYIPKDKEFIIYILHIYTQELLGAATSEDGVYISLISTFYHREV